MNRDDDDRHWLVAGAIYFNPEDRRVLVRRRSGLPLAWTLNMAHPVSWVVLAVGSTAGFVYAVAIILTHHY